MTQINGEINKVRRRLPALATGLVLLLQVSPAWSFTLEEAVDRAVKSYPEVRAAMEERKSQEKKVREEFAGYLPVIDLSVGYGREYSDNPTTRGANVEGQHSLSLTRGETGLTLKQMIFDGYDVRNQVAEAEASLKAASANEQKAFADTARRAVNAYSDVVIRQAQLLLVIENVRLHNEILKKVRIKFEGGAGNEADVHQAESRTHLASAGQASTQLMYDAALARFLEIVGAEPPEGMTQPDIPEDQLPASLDEALELAMKHNLELERDRMKVVQEEAKLKSAKANFWPQVDLEIGATDNANMSGSPGHSKSAAAMLRMSYNVYKGGADKAGVEGSRSLLAKAQKTLDSTQRSVVERVSETWSKYQSSKERINFLTKHVAVSRKVVSSYHNQFKMGKRTLLDVLNSETELFSAQNTLHFENLTFIKTSYEILDYLGSLNQLFATTQRTNDALVTLESQQYPETQPITISRTNSMDMATSSSSWQDEVVLASEAMQNHEIAQNQEEVIDNAPSQIVDSNPFQNEPVNTAESVTPTEPFQQIEEMATELVTQPADDATASTPEEVVIVDVPSLNMRSGPSVKLPTVKKLPKGTVLIVENVKYGWLKVIDPDKTGGWVAGYLTQDPKTGKRLDLSKKQFQAHSPVGKKQANVTWEPTFRTLYVMSLFNLR